MSTMMHVHRAVERWRPPGLAPLPSQLSHSQPQGSRCSLDGLSAILPVSGIKAITYLRCRPAWLVRTDLPHSRLIGTYSPYDGSLRNWSSVG